MPPFMGSPQWRRKTAVPAPKKDGLDGVFTDMMREVREFGKRRVEDMRSPSPLPAALMNPNPTPAQREVLQGSAAAIAESVGGPARAAGKVVKRGIQAWHGSPHKFDKFDISKIGTGEGAQQYGHGLYFADARAVADNYKKSAPMVNIGGKPIRVAFADEMGNATPEQLAAKVFWSYDGNVARASDILYRTEKSGANYGHRISPEVARRAREIVEAGQVELSKGHTYRVNIDAAPQQLLDWDAPLSAQSRPVQTALNRRLQHSNGSRKYFDNDDPTGGDINNMLYQSSGPQGASERLREAGIPGIKYADGQSRKSLRVIKPSESVSGKWVVGEAPNGPNQFFANEADAMAHLAAEEAKKTRNYVMFDPRRIKILETLAAMGMVGGTSAMPAVGRLTGRREAK